MMTMIYAFIAMGVIAIVFLLYMLYVSIKHDPTKTDEPVKQKFNSPFSDESLQYASTTKVRMPRPDRNKQGFQQKPVGYRKNYRVNDLIVEEVVEADEVMPLDPLDVMDAVENITYLTQNSDPVIIMDNTQSSDIYTPSNDYNTPHTYDTPVQDNWSSSSDSSSSSQGSWIDNSPSSSDSSSYSSSNDYSSSSSSYSDSSSSSSYDYSSSSSSYDSGSSSSFDSGSGW